MAIRKLVVAAVAYVVQLKYMVMMTTARLMRSCPDATFSRVGLVFVVQHFVQDGICLESWSFCTDVSAGTWALSNTLCPHLHEVIPGCNQVYSYTISSTYEIEYTLQLQRNSPLCCRR